MEQDMPTIKAGDAKPGTNYTTRGQEEITAGDLVEDSGTQYRRVVNAMGVHSDLPLDYPLQTVDAAVARVAALVGLPEAELRPQLADLDDDELDELADQDGRTWVLDAVADLLADARTAQKRGTGQTQAEADARQLQRAAAVAARGPTASLTALIMQDSLQGVGLHPMDQAEFLLDEARDNDTAMPQAYLAGLNGQPNTYGGDTVDSELWVLGAAELQDKVEAGDVVFDAAGQPEVVPAAPAHADPWAGTTTGTERIVLVKACDSTSKVEALRKAPAPTTPLQAAVVREFDRQVAGLDRVAEALALPADQVVGRLQAMLSQARTTARPGVVALVNQQLLRLDPPTSPADLEHQLEQQLEAAGHPHNVTITAAPEAGHLYVLVVGADQATLGLATELLAELLPVGTSADVTSDLVAAPNGVEVGDGGSTDPDDELPPVDEDPPGTEGPGDEPPADEPPGGSTGPDEDPPDLVPLAVAAPAWDLSALPWSQQVAQASQAGAMELIQEQDNPHSLRAAWLAVQQADGATSLLEALETRWELVTGDSWDIDPSLPAGVTLEDPVGGDLIMSPAAMAQLAAATTLADEALLDGRAAYANGQPRSDGAGSHWWTQGWDQASEQAERRRGVAELPPGYGRVVVGDCEVVLPLAELEARGYLSPRQPKAKAHSDLQSQARALQDLRNYLEQWPVLALAAQALGLRMELRLNNEPPADLD